MDFEETNLIFSDSSSDDMFKISIQQFVSYLKRELEAPASR